MDAPRGRDLHGRCIAPDPKAERNKLRVTAKRRFSLPGARVARVAAVSYPGTFTGIEVTK
jgi:hypothetical protein